MASEAIDPGSTPGGPTIIGCPLAPNRSLNEMIRSYPGGISPEKPSSTR